ncbi:MAG: cobalamin biosynthesis protein [Methanotrichaceae archaeon]|nr:cobalamin biosynthesis protein [Methanotrichaceae archaeon]
MEKGTEMALSLEVFLLAIALDLVTGEPPAKIHPVVWIGKLISFLHKQSPQTRGHGFMLAITVTGTTILAGSILVWIAGYIPFLGTLIAAYLLKSTFALRGLLETSYNIGKRIDQNLSKAKEMLPALVSRDTAGLTKSQAASAVIESLSENYVDTLISPMFFFLLFEPFDLGLQAALGFKAVSTMDSMLGYKDKGLKELGFAPAKMDDLANFLPARLSIFFIALANPKRAKDAISTALRYHKATPSPNSGWPMSACSGSLNVRLEKPGYYVLLEEGKEPQTSDIQRALEVIGLASALVIGTTTLVLL